MIEKVLIANRGAIAVRIIRTLKSMGIQSVAVYAEVDAASAHVTAADEAWPLGDGGASQTYLDQDKLFSIIERSGAQAVHPGYGFLSENAIFARRCEEQSVIFLGPTAQQMEDFGLKHCARDLAQQAGVPLLPGTGLLETLEEASSCASNMGYPVMLKSTAGGGGIGMQLCYDERDLTESFDTVRRLGENNFSNSGIFLEKFVERARHIEVQVFGDGKGNAIALGERDCSSQRRNQKVIEETPAPNLSTSVRQQLHQCAVDLAASVDYRSAGTVEFIYDPVTESAYFLEVNTRLQVEHGVTEQVYGVDLVAWMVQLGAGNLPPLHQLSVSEPDGHAIQVRVYGENPGRNFQPSAGLLSQVEFPEANGKQLRIDHWLSPGIEVSAFFDPMLAKVIAWQPTRNGARQALADALASSRLYGIETNLAYLQTLLNDELFIQGEMYTRYLDDFHYSPASIDVISPGTLTTVQDYPGRAGYWNVGVPPSGPFDDLSFRLGNRCLGNPEGTAGFEITLNGPQLKFNRSARIIITGADMGAVLEGTETESLAPWTVKRVESGDSLRFGKVLGTGARSYLLVEGGIQCPDYLGSKSTFTLGQFGGHVGRALRKGDVLHLAEHPTAVEKPRPLPVHRPELVEEWVIRVVYGPHGAPDFFTDSDMESFFSACWEVHYNSSRTGIRLIGPKPEWARSDGGEAGMHPSNIHDNAYAFGTVDFTGDMPVILGPDGPSLGGFVCPATVISADRWKLGQLKAGSRVRFVPVSLEEAADIRKKQDCWIAGEEQVASEQPFVNEPAHSPWHEFSPVLAKHRLQSGTELLFRAAGDEFLLVELGEPMLDVALRFQVHGLMLRLEEMALSEVVELTPGIRSLQLHYRHIKPDQLISRVVEAAESLGDVESLTVPSRIVHLPLSWNDKACQIAVEKYMQSVRKDAPWCPDNLEFIRRINGLSSVEEVKKLVFDASYVVMGLGDVYLGAPVATPLDPRHRLVTTKYNPARTWTAENSVGIGGSYLCVYGMEGPGGYQFIGRTLQMWNRYRQTADFSQPWLLRFFDQIRFYEVSDDELLDIRRKFPLGEHSILVEETTFSLQEYLSFLDSNQESISAFSDSRQKAFDQELRHWRDSGQMNFLTETVIQQIDQQDQLPADCIAIDSDAAGSIWQVQVVPGQSVKAGDVVVVLESMKMEIEVVSPESGTVESIFIEPGQMVQPGQQLLALKERS